MLAEFRQNFCRHCSPWEACLNTFNSGSLRSFKAINFKRQFSEWHLDVELVQRGWTPWKQTKAGTLRWKRQKDYLKWRFPPYTRNFLVLICNYFWKWQHLKEKYRKDNITNTREATIYIYKNDAKTTEKPLASWICLYFYHIWIVPEIKLSAVLCFNHTKWLSTYSQYSVICYSLFNLMFWMTISARSL